MEQTWPLLSGSVLALIITWVVILSFMGRLIRRWRVHRHFARRFHQPPLAVTIGDTVVTSYGFTGEVLAVTGHHVELRIGSGARTSVITVYRGDILALAPPRA
jgi:preprotein translocase subunit YajC